MISELKTTAIGRGILFLISYCCMGTKCGKCDSCIKHKNSELLADANPSKFSAVTEAGTPEQLSLLL